MILALAPATSAQKDAQLLWRVRSQNITDDLLKDGADLSSMQRAVLWMKLAQRWWPDDPKRARIWITNAIEVVEQVPNKETPEERGKRLQTARDLLTIVTPLDQKYIKRLMTVLTSEARAARSDTAGALIDAAVAVVDEDPKRAAEIAAMALRTGAPQNLDQLAFRLRERDPKLADALFVQALAVAKQGNPDKLLNSLMYIAFPAQRGIRDKVSVPPEPLRVEVLQILLGLLNADPENGKDPNCGIVGWIAPLFGEIERLLPQQFPVVRQAINRCQSVSPLLDQRLDDSTTSQPLNTVESLLDAAADAKDMQVRTVYAHRAAVLAEEHKDYELAVKILDDMSKEQREFMGESWDSFRWNWAADGAIEHYKNGRFREMNVLLDAVPTKLQPFAKAGFITWLPEGAVSETAPVIQILNDAIAGLRRSNVPESDKYGWYFGLLRATVKYQPADANAVLKDAISSLNKVKEANELSAVDYYFRTIGPPLLEMDEFVVKDALASVTLVQTRAQLRLSLLAATLQRVRSMSPK
jgi:hypothetical protein